MVLAVGFGLFGFTFVLASGVALSYVTDCYQEVSQFTWMASSAASNG
jgi:hypothetical protein